MDSEQNAQGGPRNDQGELAALVPKISRRTMMIVAGVALVVVLAALFYLFLKKGDMPSDVIMRDTPNGPVVLSNTIGTGTVDATPPEVVKDRNGREYITGEIIVVFRSTVPVEEAKRAIEKEGGIIKQHFANMPVFLVGISEGGAEGVNRAMLRYQVLSGVERVEPNYIGSLTGEEE